MRDERKNLEREAFHACGQYSQKDASEGIVELLYPLIVHQIFKEMGLNCFI